MNKNKIFGGLFALSLGVVALASCNNAQPATTLYTVKFVSDGTCVSKQRLEAGATITAPTSPKDYETDKATYTFNGWYDNNDGSKKFEPGTTATKDVTYEAKFDEKVKDYVVTFVYNDGETATVTKKYGEKVYPSDVAEPEGYVKDHFNYDFDAWYSDGVSLDQDGATVLGDKEYTAEYTLGDPIDYKVEFYDIEGKHIVGADKLVNATKLQCAYPAVDPIPGAHFSWIEEGGTKHSAEDDLGLIRFTIDSLPNDEKAPIKLTLHKDEDVFDVTFTINGEVAKQSTYTISDTVETLMAKAPVIKPDDSVIGYWDTPAQIVVGGMTVTGHKAPKLIDFNDATEVPLLSIKEGFQSLEIVDGEGVGGSKCVKATSSVAAAENILKIDTSYLDIVFGDPNVKAVAFDAKASVATSNFRHRLVNKADVGGRDDLVECYERNLNGYGVETTWKTFYLSRGVYEGKATGSKMSDNDNFIKSYLNNSTSLYIDNLRASYTDADDTKTGTIDFENGGFIVNGTNRFVYAHDSNTQLFQVTGAGALNVDFTNDPKFVSHGNRALHITKQNGWFALYTSTAFVNSLDNEGMLFDMYFKVADSSGVDQDATPLMLNSNKKWAYNKINQWGAKTKGYVTYHLKKDQIGTDGRFLVFSNSHAGDIYIDNIRPVNSSSTLVDFESSHAWKGAANEHVYSTGFEFTQTAEQPETRVRDTYADYEFMANGANVDSCAISNEHVSHGLKSFKVTMKGGGYFALFINPSVIDSCARSEKGLKIDVYLDGISFPDTSIFSGCKQGAWTTVTIPFSSFEMKTVTGQSGTDWDPSTASQQCSNGRFYPGNCTATGNKTIYFDNIRAA